MLGATPILPLEAPPADGNLGPLPPSQVTEQFNEEKDSEVEQTNSNSAPASVATHTKTIGIIHPPPDIRNIVDKTAQFVAKNGPEFEKRIIASNANNAKFNFLSGSDPYHAYYEHKLSEFRAQNQVSVEQPGESAAPEAKPAPAAVDGAEAAAKPDLQAQFRPAPPKPLDPPEPEKYTVRLPEGITSEELDIIKLTAQFVARNGKSFLTGLTSREISNPQFHFLKPTHSMFSFFTNLVDAYSEVLMPSKDFIEKLRKSAPDMTTVLRRCSHRLEWERVQAQQRQKEEDEKQLERDLMASIDWHDFVVVETIDFVDEEDDELPPPMTLEEVIRRSKISAMEEDEIVEPGKEVEMEMDEEEVKLVEEGMRAANLEENGAVQKDNVKEEPEPPMRIVRNWKRPEERILAERDPTKFVVSPITGELIPISEMSEHMRISLIDPKYKEQKDRMFAKIRETTLAQDDEIARNIVGLARTRPDIFGTTEEEVSNAVKAEIEKKDEQPKQVIWDGHTGSIGRTANQALTQSANGEDQGDAAIGDASSNLPGPAAPPPLRPGVISVRPLPPPPGLTLNLPRIPPPSLQYPGAPRPVGIPMMPSMHQALQSPMPMASGQPSMLVNRPPGMQPSMGQHGMPVPPPPGSQFAHIPVPRPFTLSMPPPPTMPMMQPPPMPGVPPPPPPEEAPPPLPEEPEPKKQKLDESALIPEEQFLAQHLGSATIKVSVPNVDDGQNLKGQVLEITVQTLSETVGSLKEKIAGEIQLPANKQKLSGKAGFLKDNMSLAHYNVCGGDTLALSLRERGGRKR
ncbi:PREDICTED: probable splicing factor 3A subunit 1 [Tarenaya hassleriana]|uniref:probable splicing factor 3A subunit 1 n=1 Tax=Tarenaya hassleriana TaxID=28532 RepID=UPI00053CA517|nr:PREDICTED: probable splicing factor 3A subunit 1 [Tarenaya hassleriana]XP_010523415.1 PREDICTED: probable splicing factor 3A subunit 1 [Tarenaya hassleriana]XP_019056653.1 PREDICTED: probable splicing factor 3A subunit 1 [Tarenaya hassleriana]